MNKYLFNMLKQICKELNIDIEYVSDNNSIIILKKNKIIKYIVGFNFDLNSCTSKLICDDKYLLYEMLNNNNIKVIDTILVDIIHNYTIDILLEQLKKHKKIVCKSTNGTMGYQVFTCETEQECKTIFDYFLIHSINFIINPFEFIDYESRVIILNNNIEIVYKKIKQTVIGDGKSTLLQLINQNNDYNEFMLENCLKKELTLDMIPKKEEQIEYSWKDNLCTSAIPFLDIDNKDLNTIKKLALKAFKTISGLCFASVDIIKTKKGKFKILEINSGIMMENFYNTCPEYSEMAYNLYHKAISLMMEIKNDMWSVYLIQNKNCTYVGATPDTEKRIKKHNGELAGGAKYTSSKGPGWAYICIISGFDTKVNALRFEWAFKHQKPKTAGVKNRIKKLITLCSKERWTSKSPLANTIPLTITWINKTYKPVDNVFPEFIKSI